MSKLGIGDFDERGLGPEGDAEARFLDHQLVVGAIADGKDVVAS